MIQLRGITWDHTRGHDPMVATAVEFQRETTNVQITWDKRSLHDFGHAPVDKLAERYDLVVLDHPWVGFICKTESYFPLDHLLPADALDELRQHSAGPSHVSYQWQDRQWALAIDAATPTASYRPDLLDRLNVAVPTTWNEVLELGHKCREIRTTVGLPLGPVDAITAFLSLADNIGGAPFACPRQVVDFDIGRQVLAALRAIVEICPSDVFELSPIVLMDRMSSTDEIAYCPLAYSYNNYARRGYRPHLCRYADMPALGSGGCKGSHLGGTGLAISRRCQHPELAAQYALKVASSTWQRTIYYAAGGQPAHLAAWNDPVVNETCSNFFIDTRRTIEQAFLRPRYDGYIRFQYDGGALVTAYLRDGGDSIELLRKLDQLYCDTLGSE